MGFEPKTFGNALSGGFRNGVFGALPSGTVETLIVAVDCGRSSLGVLDGWNDDSAFTSTGSSQYDLGLTVDDSGLRKPTTTAIWNSTRNSNHSYLFTTSHGIIANASYRVEVLTTENYYSSAGQRLMTISVNGATKVTDFDAFVESGNAQLIAVDALEGVGNVNADGSGEISISVVTGTGGQIFGIRIYKT